MLAYYCLISQKCDKWLYRNERRGHLVPKARRARTLDIYHQVQVQHPPRANINIVNETILVASDCHYWPGNPSTCHRALVKFIKELKPKAVILNGDIIDACTISRFPPIGWENLPTVQEEIEAAQDRLYEIEQACNRGTQKFWTLGNHDMRFERRLATVAPEYAKVAGVHLRDHFPLWTPCWSVWINTHTVVKHRFKGGKYAPDNNVLMAGKSIVTGHLHSAQVAPWTDFNGTRYGVDTGCLADEDHKAFIDYTEDNAKNWRSGFCVLTFKNGTLLQPELVLKWDSKHVQFRGEIVPV